MHSPSSTASATLADAAFGARPGLAPLPPAATSLDSWHRAVALGGQGHYSGARAELTCTRRLAAREPVLLSLARSTEASLLRQLGWHRDAAPIDGLAATLLAGIDSSDPRAIAARCDAWTGLAADALGQGRFALGKRLLDRSRENVTMIALSGSSSPSRQQVRIEWVSAEIALATGESAQALRFARAGADMADAGSSIRHRIKSQLLVAASLCATGDFAAAGERASDLLEQCDEHGLVPLRWATSMLLDGLGDAAGSGRIAAECAASIDSRGGKFRVV